MDQGATRKFTNATGRIYINMEEFGNILRMNVFYQDKLIIDLDYGGTCQIIMNAFGHH